MADKRQIRIFRLVKIVLFLAVATLIFGGCFDNLFKVTRIKLKKDESGQYEIVKGEVSLSNLELDSTVVSASGTKKLTYIVKDRINLSGIEKVVIFVDADGNGIAKIYDPLILQLPIHVWPIAGSYSCELGGLQQGDLLITRMSTVPVTPLQTIYPEPGHRLYIVDFPDGVNFDPVEGQPRVFETSIRLYNERHDSAEPQYPVKFITSGKFTLDDDTTYYLPIYPVETDFSKLPAIILGEPHAADEEYEVPVPDMSAFPFIDELSYDLRTPTTLLHKLYYPHVASDETWETEIAIINDDTTSALAGTLFFYSNFGEILGGLPIELPPHGRKEVVVGDLMAANASRVGYAVFEHRLENRVVGYAKYFVDGVSRTAVPALPDSELNQGEVFIPHIASSDEWETGISLVNTKDTTVMVQVKTNNGVTINYEVWGRGRAYFTFASQLSENLRAGLSSATITNGDGIIGVEIFGSTQASVNKYLSGVLLRDDTATTMYYPHTVSDDLWWTGVVGYNPQSTSARVTVTPYSAAGEDLSAEFAGGELSIPGSEKYLGAVSALQFPMETAWFKLESTQPLTGFELFGKVNGTQLAGYTSCNIDAQNGIFPKLEKAGWSGIAFVNIGQSTTVILKAYDDAGQLVATSEPLALAANEKKVAVAQEFFEADISQATYLTFSADAPIVGFQLNSANDGMMLDGLPAL